MQIDEIIDRGRPCYSCPNCAQQTSRRNECCCPERSSYREAKIIEDGQNRRDWSYDARKNDR